MHYEKTVPPDPEVTTPDGSRFAAALALETARDLESPPGYELHEEVGHGGMGVVYRARDLALERDVAVKLLRRQFSAGSANALRFLDEAKITGQLQHPGIPAVHAAGTLPSGRPFLAMKLIRGSSLSDLIHEKSPINELAVFEQIAQAVGYAHAHQVIHRDLKPANVMVGAFGEVQVMDWGLAKHLASPERQHDLEVPSGREGVTTAGSMLGTPAYMPPEQAVGNLEALSPASDVFGLGGILCALLTGEPPFLGADVASTRRIAQEANLDGAYARLDACGADPELIALCRRCLAVEPRDRPSNGAAVAEAVAKLRNDANERARRAEIERGQAEVYAAEQRKRRILLGWSASAVVIVLGIGAALVAWQYGRALDEQVKTAKALAIVTEKQDKLVGEKKNTIAALHAMTDDVIINLISQQRTLDPTQRKFLLRIVALYEQAIADDPDAVESRELRASGLFRVAQIHRTLGDLKKAEPVFVEARDLLRTVIDEHPDRLQHQLELVGIHNSLGMLYGQTGRTTQGEAELRAGIALAQALIQHDPNALEPQRDLARLRSNLGLMMRDLGREELARAEFVAAREASRELLKRYPRDLEFQRNLAVTHVNLGGLLDKAGEADQAEDEFRAACDIGRKLVRQAPDVPEYANDLATSHNNLGVMLSKRKRQDLAEIEYRAGLDLCRALVRRYPAVPEHQSDLARQHNNVANLLEETDRKEQAEIEYRTARDLRIALVNQYPDLPRFRGELAHSHANFARFYRERGRLDLAEPEYRAAFEQSLTLVQRHPNEPEFSGNLARNRFNLGRLLHETGRREPAVEQFTAARDLLRTLVDRHPAVADYKNDLAGHLTNWANLHRTNGEFAEAQSLLEQAEPLHRAALKAEPASAGYRRYFQMNRMILLECLVTLGRHEAIAPTVADIAAFSTAPRIEHYRAARWMMKAVSLLAADQTLSIPRRQELARRYADDAMKHLNQAVEQGFTNHWAIAKESAFDPLRQRDDYWKLMIQLETKHPANEPAPMPRRN